MVRCFAAVAAALMLGGCVTTREYVYVDGSYPAGSRERVYTERVYSDDDRVRYYSDGTYYTPATSASGDYYSGDAYYRQPDYYSVSYVDYPAYYSIFHPINSWWYDPFYYPNYYYGVTFYPRNYLSFSFGPSYGYGYSYGYGWPRSSFFYTSFYSPYRYSWIDNYYAWEPWYTRHPNHHHYYPTPRYGNARREAERLASWNRGDRSYAPSGVGAGGRYAHLQRDTEVRGGVRDPRVRGVDYGPRTASRVDGGPRGIAAPAADVRRVGGTRDAHYGTTSPRSMPGRGFGTPADAPQRGAIDRGTVVRQGTASDARRETQRLNDVRRFQGGAPVPAQGVSTRDRGYAIDDAQRRRADIERAEADARGYDLPVRSTPRRAVRPSYEASNPTYARPVQQPNRFDSSVRGGGSYEPAPAAPSRGYGGPARGAAAPASAPAPAPSYSAPPPRSYSAPAPAPRETYSAPARESFSRGGDGGGRGGDGGVRRVGSNRGDR